MYVRPSTSVIVAPRADLMNRGVPPTPRKARTGELTPPGISSIAFENSSSDRMERRISSSLLSSKKSLAIPCRRDACGPRLRSYSVDALLRFDGDRLKPGESHEARRSAFRF